MEPPPVCARGGHWPSPPHPQPGCVGRLRSPAKSGLIIPMRTKRWRCREDLQGSQHPSLPPGSPEHSGSCPTPRPAGAVGRGQLQRSAHVPLAQASDRRWGPAPGEAAAGSPGTSAIPACLRPTQVLGSQRTGPGSLTVSKREKPCLKTARQSESTEFASDSSVS